MSERGNDPKDAPPDMEALAKRYMDLWQTQVASMAADPKLAEAMSKTMTFMSEAAQNMGAPPGMGAGRPGDEAGGSQGATGPTGATATQSAPGPSGADLDGLAQRIDALDRRIAILEAALGGILAQSGTGSDNGS